MQRVSAHLLFTAIVSIALALVFLPQIGLTEVVGQESAVASPLAVVDAPTWELRRHQLRKQVWESLSIAPPQNSEAEIENRQEQEGLVRETVAIYCRGGGSDRVTAHVTMIADQKGRRPAMLVLRSIGCEDQ